MGIIRNKGVNNKKSRGRHIAECESCGGRETVNDAAWDRVSPPKCSACGGMLFPDSKITDHLSGTKQRSLKNNTITRSCIKCGCKLRSGNEGDWCSPCTKKWEDSI